MHHVLHARLLSAIRWMTPCRMVRCARMAGDSVFKGCCSAMGFISLYNLCSKHSPRPLTPQGRLRQSVRKSSCFIMSNVFMGSTLNSLLTSGKWRFARVRPGLGRSFVTTHRFWTSARA